MESRNLCRPDASKDCVSLTEETECLKGKDRCWMSLCWSIRLHVDRKDLILLLGSLVIEAFPNDLISDEWSVISPELFLFSDLFFIRMVRPPRSLLNMRLRAGVCRSETSTQTIAIVRPFVRFFDYQPHHWLAVGSLQKWILVGLLNDTTSAMHTWCPSG